MLIRLAIAATLLCGLQDKSVEQVLDAADKTLDEARKVYESAKASGSLVDLIGASFLAEDARFKYQAAQEFATGAAQTRAASQFRVANQLLKLINDARKAAGAAAPPPDAAPAPAEPLKPPPPPPARRPAAPPADKVEAAEKILKELFKAEYARDRRALAKNLLAKAPESAADPTSQWTMLQEARELAVQAGDADTAVAAVDALDLAFEVNAGALKAAVLTALSRSAKSPDDLLTLARRTREWAEEESEAENYSAAEKAWTAAGAAARKAGDAGLAAAATARAKEVAALRSRFESVKTQRETLTRNPADPPANQGVGEYLCFVRRRWEAGLPLLAKGVDASLKALAKRELAPPGDTNAQIAVGDSWWDHAAKAKGDAADASRERAAHWYGLALPAAAGLEKLRIQKRLEEMEAAALKTSGAIDLLRLVDPAKDGVQGTWKLDQGELVCDPGDATRLQIPYVPPDEYDLLITFERRTGNRGIAFALARGGAQWAVGWDYFPTQGYRSGLLLLDGAEIPPGTSTLSGAQLSNGRKHELLIQVRKTGLKAKLDGKPSIEWEGAASRLSLPPNSKLPQANTLGLVSWGNHARFSRVLLTPVSGSGRKLR